MKLDLTRREFMGAGALAVAGAMLPSCSKEARSGMETGGADYESLPPLRETAEKKGMLYGAAVGTHNLRKDARFREAVIRECNVIVPEYEGKWKALMPERRGAWHHEAMDELVLFAERNGMKVRGHTLIWHAAFPDWAKEALKEGQGAGLMREYIFDLVSRYRGRIFSWDVVNEAIEPKDGIEGGLRKTPWLEALGPDYIEQAFRIAHEADPSAQLVYNDYGLENDKSKTEATIALLRRLIDKGVKIHAIGLQSHLKMDKAFIDLKELCTKLKSLEIDTIITELDIWNPSFFNMGDKNDFINADKVKEYLNVITFLLRPKQIITWGLSDKYSWLSSPKWNRENLLGQHARGLPLDKDFFRKPMWNVLHEIINRA